MEDTADEEVKAAPKPLGQRLMESGLISEEQLNVALNESKSKGIFLGQALETLGILTQDVITGFLADESDSEIVDLNNCAIDPEVIKLIPYELTKRHQFLPLSRKGDVIKAAVVDTLNIHAVEAIEMATGLSVDVVTAPKNQIIEAIERYYVQKEDYEHIIKSLLSEGDGSPDDNTDETLPIIRLVDLIISKAIKTRATDIHFEPDAKVLRVRLRIDGVLHQEVLVPKQLQAAMTARLKIMGGLDMTETRLPMDGRITFDTGTRSIDLRMSSLPVSCGETIVLRVLDKESVNLSLTSLEFSSQDKETIQSILKNPNGLILVTGPTGSGKTSTLYAALGILNTLERSILTMEDPVEYELPVIRQTPVNIEVGMDFPMGLRAMLRQDPDVIMVGEIRDGETANLAIRAALTGHLVLSTLHTNSSAAAIPRLVDIGIKPYLVSSSLKAVIAQRLIRRLCSNCITDLEPEEMEQAFAGTDIEISDEIELQFYKGLGCGTCNNSGYHGRLGVFEILKLDHRFHDLIVNNAGVKETEDFAKSLGMRTLVEDALEKASKGLTSLEEVFKLTQDV